MGPLYREMGYYLSVGSIRCIVQGNHAVLGGSFSGGKHAELTPPWQLIQELLFQEEGE